MARHACLVVDELLASVRTAARNTETSHNQRRLHADMEGLREQFAAVASERDAAFGREAQLSRELAIARTETAAERRAGEEARTELAKAQLRMEALTKVEYELAQAHSEREAQLQARIQARQAVAVLKAEFEAARAAYDQLEKRNEALAEQLERERKERSSAELELAVHMAMHTNRHGPEKPKKREASKGRRGKQIKTG